MNEGEGRKVNRERTIALVLLFAFFISITAPTYAYPPSTNDWPNFHGNLENTGLAYPVLLGIPIPQLLWSYTTDNVISPSSPSLADIDNDGELEVVVGTANFANTGGIYAIEADGTLKWKYPTGDYGTYACPAIDDIDDDGLIEIVFVSYAGKITVLEHDGTAKWILDKGSAGTKVAIADVDGDGDLEVIAGAANKIWLLNADGTEAWNKDFIIGTEPAVADVDGDGDLEIVFAALGTKTIVALNADGGTQWTSSPVAGQDCQVSLSITNDLNSDGKPDIAVGCRDQKIYAYSGADGTQLWSYLTVGRVFGIAVADIDGDSFDDVVATATKGDGVESYVYVLDKDGSLIWSHNIVGLIAYTTEGTPSIADVDKDGVLDVVTGSTSMKVYALSGVDGSEIWTFDIANPSPSALAIADINGDTVMDVVIATADIVYCITGPPPPPRPVGGVWVPINKLELLAPWIGLASLITVASVSIVYVKRKKKQQK